MNMFLREIRIAKTSCSPISSLHLGKIYEPGFSVFTLYVPFNYNKLSDLETKTQFSLIMLKFFADQAQEK